MTAFRLRRPSSLTSRRAQETRWEVYHETADLCRFGHIDQSSMSWRAFDWKGRPLDSHRIMTRTEAAQLVADNYAQRHKL